MKKVKTVPDAGVRFARVAEQWDEVRRLDGILSTLREQLKEARDAREKILEKIGEIIDEAQLSLPFPDARETPLGEDIDGSAGEVD